MIDGDLEYVYKDCAIIFQYLTLLKEDCQMVNMLDGRLFLYFENGIKNELLKRRLYKYIEDDKYIYIIPGNTLKLIDIINIIFSF